MSEKPYIIAEIASAHEGKISILRKLIGQVINSMQMQLNFKFSTGIILFQKQFFIR